MARIQTKPKVKTPCNEHTYFAETFWHSCRTTIHAETELPDGTMLTKEVYTSVGVTFITYSIYTNKTKKYTVEQVLRYLHKQRINLEKDDPSTIGILHLKAQTQLIIVLIEDL